MQPPSPGRVALDLGTALATALADRRGISSDSSRVIKRPMNMQATGTQQCSDQQQNIDIIIIILGNKDDEGQRALQ